LKFGCLGACEVGGCLLVVVSEGASPKHTPAMCDVVKQLHLLLCLYEISDVWQYVWQFVRH